jgi:hypothetical protein
MVNVWLVHDAAAYRALATLLREQPVVVLDGHAVGAI